VVVFVDMVKVVELGWLRLLVEKDGLVEVIGMYEMVAII